MVSPTSSDRSTNRTDRRTVVRGTQTPLLLRLATCAGHPAKSPDDATTPRILRQTLRLEPLTGSATTRRSRRRLRGMVSRARDAPGKRSDREVSEWCRRRRPLCPRKSPNWDRHVRAPTQYDRKTISSSGSRTRHVDESSHRARWRLRLWLPTASNGARCVVERR